MLGWCMCCILPIQPLKLYLSPAHQFVLTGLPQWWLHHPDAAEQLASQPWHAVKRSSQPSAWAFFCPIKPQSPSHPVTASHQAVSFCLFFHAECIPCNNPFWFKCCFIIFTPKFNGYKSPWIICRWSEVHRTDSGSPKQTWWDVMWGTEVEELGYDQPAWRQGAFFFIVKATHSLSRLVSDWLFHCFKCGQFIERQERYKSLQDRTIMETFKESLNPINHGALCHQSGHLM